MRLKFWRGTPRDRDFDDEISHDLAMDAEERVRDGVPQDEAMAASRRDFGSVVAVKESARAAWGWAWLETWAGDIRYAFRMMRKTPGFTTVAVLSLALGIGVNATMFSMADALLFRPLSVTHPNEIVTVFSKTPSDSSAGISYPDYRDFLDRARSFQGLVAFQMRTFGFTGSPRELPQMRMGMLVSGNFFQVMGVEPALGRAFRPDEDEVPGRDAVIVLGHGFWQKQLAADNSIIGSKVRINGVEFTVIGVAPERFEGMDQYFRPAFLVPLAMAPRLSSSAGDQWLEKRDSRQLTVKGRLAHGVRRAQADAELTAIAKALEQAYPATNHDRGVTIQTELQTRLRDDPDDALLVAMLLGLSGMVLLVACANVANLLLSRARSRTREIAIRMAIGASRTRLVRQLLAESCVIALAGGALSLLLAYGGAAFLSRIQIPSDLPLVIDVRVDHRVLLFSMAASLFSVILFGLAPALEATRTSLVRVLKSDDADSSRKRRLWGRHALVVTQVALSLVLIVVAAMLTRAFGAVLVGGPGFRTDHLLMMSFDPTLALYSKPRAQQFYKQLMDRARAIPGVESATLVSTIPLSPNQRQESIVPEGYQFPNNRESAAMLSKWVDDRFFDTMGVSIVRGRGFDAHDIFGGPDSPRLAVVNEVLAQHYWPNQDPIGKRFQLTDRHGPWVRIVGIAKTSKYTWVGEPPTEYLYLALNELPYDHMTLVVRSLGDPASMVAPLREMVRGLDPNQPVYDVRTMQDLYHARSAVIGVVNDIVAAMGLIGLALAMIGLYGLVAYSVARRTREIGIRMAIGAGRGSVVRMVLRQGLTLAMIGLAIGLAISFAAERAVMALFGATKRDLLAYALMTPCVLAVTGLAAWVPALRASRVDPMRALRDE